MAYRALAPLTYPTNAAAIAAIIAGEEVPWEDRDAKTIEAGAVADDIPAVSIPWLLEQGIIELVTPPAAPPPPPPVDGGEE